MPRSSPISRFRIWLYRQLLVGEHAGILLADANRNPHDNRLFVEKTRQALDLIAQVDPRRFNRVRSHLAGIVNIELAMGGEYAAGGICHVDFGRLDFTRHPEWYLCMYAALLVHEATHGFLRDRGVRRTRRNKMEHERLCRTEENRFLARIVSPWGEQLRKPFNPESWNIGSGCNRIRLIRKRRQEEESKARAAANFPPPPATILHS